MSSKSKRTVPPAGEIRRSQILSTFGPGSMVDLPNNSVIIGGLNHWQFGSDRKRIFEDRLEDRLKKLLDVDDLKMFEPPASNQEQAGGQTGITSFVFPEWFVAQIDETWIAPSGKEYRTRPLRKRSQLHRGKYLDDNRKKHPVVPIRFVQACVNGHISDINWHAFVHDNFQTTCRAQLWLDEGGTGNDFADIFVRCEACRDERGQSLRRPLSDATLPNNKVLGRCEGERPWLGPHAAEPTCVAPETSKVNYNRLLVRSASNAYFSQVLNVISLPSADEALKEAVGQVYEDFLLYAEDVDDVRRERRKQKVANALEGFSNEAVWAEVNRRKNNILSEDKTIKQVEIETLLSQPDEVGEDVPEGDFYARNRTLSGLSLPLQSKIERIVLVHRLREVMAQVGFTRFEPAIPDVDGELKLDVSPAALDIDISWVPAVENKGEGIFLGFKETAIDDWLLREAVKSRANALRQGFDVWLKRRGIDPTKFKFPGAPYIMLHSLSHLLITAVSLECGYSTSAIRERIYAGDSGYGILLYTGSTGSEGTLGGLVQVGKHIEQHLATALELGKLCSNDPVCAQHTPHNPHEERFLHGAACHGCLLISETSCERRNEFLDRALVVETVGTTGAAFFSDTDL
ncbi:MAG: DUF1998 domain-containing protein [Cyanobacteria bacterium P01_A01_bin.17]